MQREYTIFIREKDGTQGQRLNDYVSLNIVDTLNDLAKWTLKSKAQAECPFSAGQGISVYRDGDYIFGGVATEITDTLDATTGLHDWQVNGSGDLEYLRRRICYVDPQTGNPQGAGHYTDTGKLSDVVETLISLNLGASALADRQEAIIGAYSGASFGETVSISLRFQNLLDAVKALCIGNGYNIRPVWDIMAKKIHYEAFQGRDLSQQIIFTEQLNNIISSEYIGTTPEANFILAGGKGELTARQFATAENADSVAEWGRIEAFQDGRNQDSIQPYADQTLNSKSDNTQGYSCTASDDTNAPQYMADYRLGDMVSMKIRGLYIVSEVQQVEINVSDGVERISPKFGVVAVSKFRQFFISLADLRQDVNELLGTEIS